MHARDEQLPPLAEWDRLGAQQVAAMARALARQQGISLLDEASARQLLDAVGRIEIH
jgi:ABC-type thiamine transport system ATPase subunit